MTDDREHDAQVAKKDERSVVVGSFNGRDRIVEYAFLTMRAVSPVDAAFTHEAVAREDAVKAGAHFCKVLRDIARFHDGRVHPLVDVEERFVCGIGIKRGEPVPRDFAFARLGVAHFIMKLFEPIVYFGFAPGIFHRDSSRLFGASHGRSEKIGDAPFCDASCKQSGFALSLFGKYVQIVIRVAVSDK